MTAASRNN